WRVEVTAMSSHSSVADMLGFILSNSSLPDSQGTGPEIGAKERIAGFGASLDHSDIRDRTFERTGQAPRNISPPEFPG
ncbi:hypothetical protein P7K49_035349, partial [Saguinus oedipus]